jgi:hypothetical protein
MYKIHNRVGLRLLLFPLTNFVRCQIKRRQTSFIHVMV